MGGAVLSGGRLMGGNHSGFCRAMQAIALVPEFDMPQEQNPILSRDRDGGPWQASVDGTRFMQHSVVNPLA